MGEKADMDVLHGENGVKGSGDEGEVYCADDFSSLPEFTCISSSSSASRQACSTSSSSGSSSWAAMKVDGEDAGGGCCGEDGELRVDVPGTADMDVLGEIGGMAILDDTDMWDPQSLFPGEDGCSAYGDAGVEYQSLVGDAGGESGSVDGEEKPSEDLALLFLEWLKSNKELISPEDLRSIKLKRSTIESAAKRLGGGREGLKKLLKLILTWVQDHHLRKKQNAGYPADQYPAQPNQQLISIPSFDVAQASAEAWSNTTQQPNYVYSDGFSPAISGAYVGQQAGVVVNNNGGFSIDFGSNPTMMDTNNMSWPPAVPATSYTSPAYGNGVLSEPAHAPCIGFSGPVQATGGGLQGEMLVRLGPLATKEARKKRMARQRQIFTHPHHHPHHHRRQQLKSGPQSPMIAGTETNCTPISTSPGAYPAPTSSVPTLTATSPISSGASMNAGLPPVSATGDHKSKQNWKVDHGNTDWKLLLQKVLKQSDVGNLGRIVLPKKEAEINLPLLDTRDGINIDLEDISTSRVWTMRYRYWPNNKSRMYLLENTGDFVRENNLQEGDFIVLYWDVRKSKYMIRAVKVPDAKNPSKAQKQFAGDNVGSSASASRATSG